MSRVMAAGRFPSDGAEPRGDGRSRRHPRRAQRRLCAGAGRARHLGRYVEQSFAETCSASRGDAWRRETVSVDAFTDGVWPTQGFLDLGAMRLEYRMIGPRPDAAPTLVLLHEGLGCVDLWGDFPDKLAAATGAGVFVYSRAGYGRSSPVEAAAPIIVHARGGAATCCRACSTPSASGAVSCSATATAPRSPRSMPAPSRIIACAGSC